MTDAPKTPYDFIAKWKPVALTERATAQEHFIDLCRLFGHPTPAEDDPAGDHFTFEKGVAKTGGGDGYADVWKKGFFAWEYKKKKRDLNKALEQLTRYAAALENPPLHVACDTHIFRIETRWTNEVPARYQFELEDLSDPRNFETLRRVFFEPDKLRSGRTRQVLTKEAAGRFQTISDSLQSRYPDLEAVAHFVNQLVFCFFADSVGLLPEGLWRRLLKSADRDERHTKPLLQNLFDEMARGGLLGVDEIEEFNGGLFDGGEALALRHVEVQQMFDAASLDWRLVDPLAFDGLINRILGRREPQGDDQDAIRSFVEYLVARPLGRAWVAVKAEIEALLAREPARYLNSAEQGNARQSNLRRAERLRDDFLSKLRALPLSDPVCKDCVIIAYALVIVEEMTHRAIRNFTSLGIDIAPSFTALARG